MTNHQKHIADGSDKADELEKQGAEEDGGLCGQRIELKERRQMTYATIKCEDMKDVEI